MKCYLHIGTEKTGTTLLQEWMYENYVAFSEQGVFLSVAAGYPNNRALCASVQAKPDDFFREKDIVDDDRRRDFRAKIHRNFADEIDAARADHDRIILTSEHFSSRLTTAGEIADLRDFLSGYFDDIRVVCYFREQSQLRTSLYSTSLRAGSSAAIGNFHPDIDEGNPYYDYDLMMSHWAEVFGADAIDAAIYDRNRFRDGDIRRDFLQRVAPGIDEDALDYGLSSANESISLWQGMLVRIVNAHLGRHTSEGEVNPKQKNLVDFILANPDLRVGRITSPDDIDVYRRFDASNRRFFKRFMNTDRNLFAPPDPAAAAKALSVAQSDSDVFFTEFHEALDTIMSNIKNEDERRVLLPLGEGLVNLLRNVALKYETGEPLTQDEGLKLMQVASMGRRHGPLIRQFINRNRPQP